MFLDFMCVCIKGEGQPFDSNQPLNERRDCYRRTARRVALLLSLGYDEAKPKCLRILGESHEVREEILL